MLEFISKIFVLFLLFALVSGLDKIERTYYFPGEDSAVGVVPAPDHGYVIVGSTDGLGAGSTDVILLRINSFGDVVTWSTYGCAAADIPLAAVGLNSNYFLVAALRHPSCNTGSSPTVHLAYYDSSCLLQYEVSLGFNRKIYRMKKALNSYVLLAGVSGTNGYMGTFKFDTQTPGLNYVHSYAYDEAIYDGFQLSDGKMIFCGKQKTGGTNYYPWLVRLSSAGSLTNDIALTSYPDVTTHACLLGTSQYVYLGNLGPGTHRNPYLMLFDISTNLVSSNTEISSLEGDQAIQVMLQLTNGDLIWAGYSTDQASSATKDFYFSHYSSSAIAYELLNKLTDTNEEYVDMALNDLGNPAVVGYSTNANSGSDIHVTIFKFSCYPGEYLSNGACVKCLVDKEQPNYGMSSSSACTTCVSGKTQIGLGGSSCYSNSNFTLTRVFLGGTNDDYGYAIIQGTDTFFYLVGLTKSKGNINGDSWVIKIDYMGYKVWEATKSCGRMDDEYGAHDVAPVSDGGVIALMYEYGDCTGFSSYRITAVRYSQTGTVSWTFDITSESGRAPYAIKNIDNNFFVVGYTNSLGSGGNDGYLLKFDSSHNVLLKKYYGGTKDDDLRDIAKLASGQLVAVGATLSYGDDSAQGYFLILSNAGVISIERHYGSASSQVFERVVLRSSTNIGVFGKDRAEYANNIYVEFDKTGVLLFATIFYNEGAEYKGSMIEMKGGDLFSVSHSTQLTSQFSGLYAIYHSSMDPFMSARSGGINDEGYSDVFESNYWQFNIIGSSSSSGTNGGMDLLFTYNKNIVCALGEYFFGDRCLPCPAGTYYNSLTVTRACIPCGIGTYQPSPGQTSCINCPVGFSQFQQGQTSCLRCTQNSYQSNTGEEFCTQCPTGSYQILNEATYCIPTVNYDKQRVFLGGSLREIIGFGLTNSVNDSIIACGQSKSKQMSAVYYLWVVKLDYLGNILWDYSDGCTSSDVDFVSSVETSDGGVLVCYMKYKNCINSNPYLMYCSKFKENGDLIWTNSLEGHNIVYLKKVAICNTGYCLFGKASLPDTTTPALLVIIASDGTYSSSTYLGGSDTDDAFYSGYQQTGGNIIAVGELHNSLGAVGRDAVFAKMDSSGSLLSYKLIGTTGTQLARAVSDLPSGGYGIFGIYVNSSCSQSGHIYWHLDLSENIVDEVYYNIYPGYGEGAVIVVTPNNEIILGQHSIFTGESIYTMQAHWIDETGKILKTFHHLASGTENCYNLILTPRGNIVLGGNSIATESAGQQDWIVETIKLYCFPGEYMNGYLCVKCPVGTYNPYWGKVGVGSCSDCQPGTYAGATGSLECTLCAENTYNAGIKASACTSCGAGYYQEQRGQTYCVAESAVPILRVFLGGTLDDAGFSLVESSSNHLYLLGTTKSKGNGDADLWLIKTTYDGEVIWDLTVGCVSEETVANLVIGTSQITALYRQYSLCNTGLSSVMHVITYDFSGTLLWSQDLYAYNAEIPSRISVSSSGGFYVVGSSTLAGSGARDGYFIKLDSTGNYIAQQYYGTASDEWLNDVLEDSTSLYLVGDKGDNGWIIKTSTLGITSSEQTYSSVHFGRIVKLSNNNLGVIGKYKNTYSVNELLVEYDSSLSVISQTKYLYELGDESGESIVGLSNTNILHVCSSNYNNPSYRGFIEVLDSSYKTTWSKRSTGDYTDKFNEVIFTAFGNYAVIGSSNSSGTHGGQDLLLTVYKLKCFPGEYMLAGVCTKCGTGTSNALSGQTSVAACIGCSTGYFQNLTGQTSCLICQAGSYSPTTGLDTCTNCEVGKKQSQPGQASCSDCDLGSFQNETGKTSCYICGNGTYQDFSGQTSCKNCPAGTHRAAIGGTSLSSCSNCSAGTFQTSAGSSYCIDCPAGTSNPNNGSSLSSDCVICSNGTYQPYSASSSCIPCPSGTYNPNTGSTVSTDCLPCNGEWAPSIHQDKCLYKGIFDTIADFVADPFSTTCFYANGLITPFPVDCRNAYRTLCCTGSSKNGVVDCNFGLGLNDTNSLFDQYCSACPFMNQTACPADGVCWDNSTYTLNSQDPYLTPFSSTCLSDIAFYCAPRLYVNSNDSECYIFKNFCGSKIQSSTYIQWDTFCITFSTTIMATLPSCSSIFNSSFNTLFQTGSFSCTRNSDTEIYVNIGSLSWPIIQYRLNTDILRDICTFYIDSTPVYPVIPMNPGPETITLTGTVNDCCEDLTIAMAISKPYPWSIVNSIFSVRYIDTSVDSAIFANVNSLVGSEMNTILIYADYLIPNKQLNYSGNISTPYGVQGFVETIYTLPSWTFTKTYCGACQFNNRTLCYQLDEICWNNWKDYSDTTLTFTSECLKADAKLCYNIWLTNGLSDPQCLDFVIYIDLTQMQQIPEVDTAYYREDGQAIHIVFKQNIRTTEFSDWFYCFDSFTQNCLKHTNRWLSGMVLELDYIPQTNNELTQITLLHNCFYRDYDYARESLPETNVSLSLPTFYPYLYIMGPNESLSCSNLMLVAVSLNDTFYSLEYQWAVSSQFGGPEAYFNSFTNWGFHKYITVPSEVLTRGTLTVSVTVRAYQHLNLGAFSYTKIINIVNAVPKVRFEYRWKYVQILDSEKTTQIPLLLQNTNCKSLETDMSGISLVFELYSDSALFGAYSQHENALETLINQQYVQMSSVELAFSQGFSFGRYYKLIARTKFVSAVAYHEDFIFFTFQKPELSCRISGGNRFTSGTSNMSLSSSESVIPNIGSDTITYAWKCQEAVSFLQDTTCICPIIPEANLSHSSFYIRTTKLSPFCKYTYSLTIQTVSVSQTRATSCNTVFVTSSGAVTKVEGVTHQGTHNSISDLYLTLEQSEVAISYSWELLKIHSCTPSSQIDISKINTYMLNFIYQYNPTFNSTLAQNEQNVSTFVQPEYLTSKNQRYLGIKQTSLLPSHRYTFGVTVNFSNSTVFALVEINNPAKPRSRGVSVLPTSGFGFETEYTIFFALLGEENANNDLAEYEIFRRDCTSIDSWENPVTLIFSTSNLYSTIFSPGKAECNYKVQIIVRAYEQNYYSENIVEIAVYNPTSSVVYLGNNVLQSLLHNNFLTNFKFSYFAAAAGTKITEVSGAAAQCLASIMSAFGLTNSMPHQDCTPSLLREYDAVIRLMLQTAQNHNINMNSLYILDMNSKLCQFINQSHSQTKGQYIALPSIKLMETLVLLGNSAEINQIKFTLGNLTEFLMDSAYPNSIEYSLKSSLIEVVCKKFYVTEMQNSVQLISPNSSSISLPENFNNYIFSQISGSRLLTDSIINHTLYTASVSIQVLAFNPIRSVKDNVEINNLTLTNSNFAQSQINEISMYYEDLKAGKYPAVVQSGLLKYSILMAQVSPFFIAENSSQIKVSPWLDLSAVNSQVKVTLPDNPLIPDYLITLPFYYTNTVWTNKNCAISNSALGYQVAITCSHMGEADGDNSSFILTLDSVVSEAELQKILDRFKRKDLSKYYSNSFYSSLIISYLVSTLIIVAILSVTFYYNDETFLFYKRLEILEERIKGKETAPIRHGFLHNIYIFAQSLKNTQPGRVTSLSIDSELSMNDSRWNEGRVQSLEDDELQDLYQTYLQCGNKYTEESQLVSVLFQEITEDEALSRITQYGIQQEFISSPFTLWTFLKYEHFYLNAIMVPDIYNPRWLKFLYSVFVCQYLLICFSAAILDPINVTIVYGISETLKLIFTNVGYVLLACTVVKIGIGVILFERDADLNIPIYETAYQRRHNKMFRKIGVGMIIMFLLSSVFWESLYSGNCSTAALKTWVITFLLAMTCEVVLLQFFRIMLKIVILYAILRFVQARSCLHRLGMLLSKVAGFFLQYL